MALANFGNLSTHVITDNIGEMISMNARLQAARRELLDHPVYGDIKTIEELRLFMQTHVFAVWDFMSLVKRLQGSLTCVDLPWMAPENSTSARLINEIVLYEETDLNFDGKPASHLDMYLEAMDEVGAETSLFKEFISALNGGMSVAQALEFARAPQHVKTFVTYTIDTAMTGTIEEVASSFLHGREDAIPKMFTNFLSSWGIDKNSIPRMTYYLQRHIDLDGDDHGPAAHKILDELIGDDEISRKRAANAAVIAVQNRIGLWDGALNEIKLVRLEKASVSN